MLGSQLTTDVRKIATLAVHEAMSKKVDRETLATAIIPQLWVMSMGPLLNSEQFSRFMKAVKEMSTRVETEHTQHLKEVKRMQDHTESYVSQQSAGGGSMMGGVTGIGAGGEIDFETLIGSARTAGGESIQVSRDHATDPFGFDEPSTASTPIQGSTPALTPSHTGGSAFLAPTKASAPTAARTLSSNGTGSALSGKTTSTVPSLAPPPNRPSLSSGLSSTSSAKPPASSWNHILNPTGSTLSATPLTPSLSGASKPPANNSTGSSGPNYNISLPPASGWTSSALTSDSSGGGSMMGLSGQKAIEPAATSSIPSIGMGASMKPAPLSMGAPLTPAASAAPPGWGGAVLQPTSKGASGTANGAGSKGADAWKDFDPFG